MGKVEATFLENTLGTQYEAGITARLTPKYEVEQEEETLAFGWDIMITPEEEPVIIEYHVDDFGMFGFKSVGEAGVSKQRYRHKNGRKAGFHSFADEHVAKDAAHDVIDDYMPDRVYKEAIDEVNTTVFVSKPVSGGGGSGVRFYDLEAGYTGEDIMEELEKDNRIVEQYVPSKDIPVTTGPMTGYAAPFIDGVIALGVFPASFAVLGFLETGDPAAAAAGMGAYTIAIANSILALSGDSLVKKACRRLDKKMNRYRTVGRAGCMRYVTGVKLEEGGGMTVTDIGGYWRTTAAAQDADTSTWWRTSKDKYLANLKRGTPVAASDRDRGKAFNIITAATADLYREWLSEQSRTPPSITVTAENG